MPSRKVTSVFDLVDRAELLRLARNGYGPEGIARKVIPLKLRCREPEDHCVIWKDGEAVAACSPVTAAERYAGKPGITVETRKPAPATIGKWRRYMALEKEIQEVWLDFAKQDLIDWQDVTECGMPFITAVAGAIGATRWRRIRGEAIPYAEGFGGRGVEFKIPGAGRVFLDAGPEKGCIYLAQVAMERCGTGLGTRLMLAIRDHAAATRHGICVYKVCNHAFFTRFDWLERDTSGDYKATWRDLTAFVSETTAPSPPPGP